MMQKQVEVHLGPPSQCTRSSSVNDTSLNERANHDIFDDIIITARTSWKINDLDPMYTTNVKTVQFRETREQPLSFRNPLYEHTCSARKRRLVSYPFGTKVKRCAVEKTIHSEASNEGSREELRGAEPIYDQFFPPPLRSGKYLLTPNKTGTRVN